MPFCSGREASLYYELQGEGPWLLFIGGLGGTTGSWYGQAPYFAKRYRTVAFDNRGAGLSGKPPGPYRMEDFSRDTVRLLDHLKIRDAFVVGLSMGGMIAQQLALDAPGRVRALALGCTHCGGPERTGPSKEVLDVLLRNDHLTQEQIFRKNLPLFFSEAFRQARPDILEEYRREYLSRPPQPPEAFDAQLEAIRDFDCCHRLGEIRAPALIVTGTEDVLIPRCNSRLLARRIPGSRLVEIPGAGHSLHVECRDRFNLLVDDFFGSCGATVARALKA